MSSYRLPCSVETSHVGFFDRALPPVLTVDSGDTVDFEIGTLFGNRVEPDMSLEDLGRLRDELRLPPELSVHTMTGPVAIRGARPGDTLEVRILEFELGGFGYNVTYPGSLCRGFLPEDFPNGHLKWFHFDEGASGVEFAPGIVVPLRPFLGIMGVGPKEGGRVSSMPPWSFGGNMDNRELVAGTALYLPVWADGALFSAGDAHAAQGNGEVTVTAIETSMRSAKLAFRVRQDMPLERPMAETPSHWISMGFDPDLDQAAKIALRDMIAFIAGRWQLSREDAYSLCSLAVDLVITQVVDGNRGVHAMLPKELAQG
ncbi:MAG: acetamidase/formamidase family protein [Chloroflexota bacterium]|nr:acetamidase/formamidase family protein [Chloroflexota bacterium]